MAYGNIWSVSAKPCLSEIKKVQIMLRKPVFNDIMLRWATLNRVWWVLPPPPTSLLVFWMRNHVQVRGGGGKAPMITSINPSQKTHCQLSVKSSIFPREVLSAKPTVCLNNSCIEINRQAGAWRWSLLVGLWEIIYYSAAQLDVKQLPRKMCSVQNCTSDVGLLKIAELILIYNLQLNMRLFNQKLLHYLNIITYLK